jgi:uncharacterized protein (DUF305 family)
VKRLIASIVMAAAVSLVAAGCGGSSDGSMPGTDHSSDTTEPAGGNASGADFNDADVMFAQGMIPHHMQAVEMAKLADDRAESQSVKDLAADVEAAQDPEVEQMTAWLEEWGQPMEMDGMDSMEMGGMMSEDQMAELADATGAEFDTMFLEMMIEHHEGAIVMARDQVDNGENEEAIALAEAIIEAQQAEIETMQGLLDAA